MSHLVNWSRQAFDNTWIQYNTNLINICLFSLQVNNFMPLKVQNLKQIHKLKDYVIFYVLMIHWLWEQSTMEIFSPRYDLWGLKCLIYIHIGILNLFGNLSLFNVQFDMYYQILIFKLLIYYTNSENIQIYKNSPLFYFNTCSCGKSYP